MGHEPSGLPSVSRLDDVFERYILGGKWTESNLLPLQEMGYSHLLGPPSLTCTSHILAPTVGLEPTFSSITLLDVRSAGGYVGINSVGLSLTSQAAADPLEVYPIRRAFRVTQCALTASRYCYITNVVEFRILGMLPAQCIPLLLH